jgi:ligand-binding SRPBCC domain-containing protein
MSKVYNFKRIQVMPTSLEKAWQFFSDPRNLETITGAEMEFRIISAHHGEKMYPGQLIEYFVKPLAGINIYWMTEITHVDEGRYFVDEQRYGPYSFWHHQHHFKEINGAVEMTDIVHYKIPFWFLGDIANEVFVKNKLRDIFDFRYQKIGELFK